MSKKFKRRDFIKILGAGAGGMMLGSSVLNALNFQDQLSKAELLNSGMLEQTPTYCEICFWKCAGWVHKKENKPWKIIGNENDPNSNGRFCPRGTGGIGMYTDPDRLKTPLIRVNKNGKQEFREASWDEAFDYIAEKLEQIKVKNMVLNV